MSIKGVHVTIAHPVDFLMSGFPRETYSTTCLKLFPSVPFIISNICGGLNCKLLECKDIPDIRPDIWSKQDIRNLNFFVNFTIINHLVKNISYIFLTLSPSLVAECLMI